MTPTRMTLEGIDETTARRELERSLALKPELDIDERRYEILRAVAWASTQAKAPVYIRVLLDRAVSVDKSVNPGDPEVSDNERRQILWEQLRDLATIGDLAELGNGYWVSLGGVLVEMESAAPRILVSGIPLRMLDREAANEVTHSGVTRHLPAGAVLGPLKLPSVDFWLWARRPSTDLKSWTRQFSSSIPIASGSPAESAEFYLPETARRGCFQSDRWQRMTRSLTGTYLYRQTVLNHWRLYGLARVDSGEIQGTCEINRQDAYRLMYGYDLLAGNPTTGIWQETGEDSGELTLHNRLPAPEMRALTALAKRLPAKKYQHRFSAAVYREQVLQTVDDLGIQLVRK